MSAMSDRLFRVALLGIVPDDDQHVIADAQGAIEDLTAALQAYIDHCPDCGQDERSPDKCQRCEAAMRAIKAAGGEQ